MRTITIEIYEPADRDDGKYGFDVVDESDQRANGLNFDEMLGQVVGLCHPKLGDAHYRMQTADEWSAQSAARAERMRPVRPAPPVDDDVPF